MVPAGDLQVGQLAQSLLPAWVADLTRKVLSSAGEGQGSELCLVCAPSQKCKDMLQPYGLIIPLFTEENMDFHGCVGPEVGGPPGFCCVHRVLALPEPESACRACGLFLLTE